MTENHSKGLGRWWYSKSGSALLAFAAIAPFTLATEQRALRRVGIVG